MNKHAKNLRACMVISPAVTELITRHFGSDTLLKAADEIDRLQALVDGIDPEQSRCLHVNTDLDGFCIECGKEIDPLSKPQEFEHFARRFEGVN